MLPPNTTQWTRAYIDKVPASSKGFYKWVYPVTSRGMVSAVATVTGMSSSQDKHVALIDNLNISQCILVIYNDSAGAQNMYISAYLLAN